MSLSVNECTIAGRLTADPEVKKTTTGLSVCNFTVAVNKENKKGEQESTEFVRCQCWRGQADFLSQYANKGSEVYVKGPIHTRSYDKQDGSKAYITEVIASIVQLSSGNKSSSFSKNTGSMGNESVKLEDVDKYVEAHSQSDETGLSIANDDLPF